MGHDVGFKLDYLEPTSWSWGKSSHSLKAHGGSWVAWTKFTVKLGRWKGEIIVELGEPAVLSTILWVKCDDQFWGLPYSRHLKSSLNIEVKNKTGETVSFYR